MSITKTAKLSRPQMRPKAISTILRSVESICIESVRQLGLRAEAIQDSVASYAVRNRIVEARRLATIAVRDATANPTRRPLAVESKRDRQDSDL